MTLRYVSLSRFCLFARISLRYYSDTVQDPDVVLPRPDLRALCDFVRRGSLSCQGQTVAAGNTPRSPCRLVSPRPGVVPANLSEIHRQFVALEANLRPCLGRPVCFRRLVSAAFQAVSRGRARLQTRAQQESSPADLSIKKIVLHNRGHQLPVSQQQLAV